MTQRENRRRIEQGGGRSNLLLGFCAVLMLAATTALAQSTLETVKAEDENSNKGTSPFIDSEDGWFDISGFLEKPMGFTVMAIPITEPAIGYGVAGGLAFLKPRKDEGQFGWSRPNITGVGGLVTENGTEGLVAGNSSVWLNGRLQTLAGAGLGSVNLDFYGMGSDPALEQDPLRYNLDFVGGLVEGRLRLGKSDFWTGLRYSYGDVQVSFVDSPAGISGIDSSARDVQIAGASVSLRYDSRNNVFTPLTGLLSESIMSFYDEAFGSSIAYQRFDQILIGYLPLGKTVYGGMRVDGQFSFGETPFYRRPYIYTRGIPALRYQGEHAAFAEMELRWQFWKRLSIVGFGGGGVAWITGEYDERSQSAGSGGMGMRYELARKFGLHFGVDVAHGPEQWAFYVQFGGAWMRP